MAICRAASGSGQTGSYHRLTRASIGYCRNRTQKSAATQNEWPRAALFGGCLYSVAIQEVLSPRYESAVIMPSALIMPLAVMTPLAVITPFAVMTPFAVITP